MQRYICVGILLLAVVVGASGCKKSWNWTYIHTYPPSSPSTSTSGGKKIKGTGNVTKENRHVSGFTGIDLAGVGDIHIQQGAKDAVVVEADKNLLPYIITEVKNGTLTIRARSHVNLHPSKSIHYYVTVKQLDSITISGSGDVTATDIKTDHFSATIAGVGDLKIDRLDATNAGLVLSGTGDLEVGTLDADSADVAVSGVGDVEIAGGHVKTLELTLSGTGDVNTEGLNSADVTATVSGVGDATVRARDQLTANVSGMGGIAYYGDPKVDKNVSGLGDISKAGR